MGKKSAQTLERKSTNLHNGRKKPAKKPRDLKTTTTKKSQKKMTQERPGLKKTWKNIPKKSMTKKPSRKLPAFSNNDGMNSSDDEGDDEDDDEDVGEDEIMALADDTNRSENNSSSEEEEDDLSDDLPEGTTDKSQSLSLSKSSLETLKEKDPEFYQFLLENDKDLLEFDPDNLSDIATDSDEEELHKPTTEQLQVASDDEDDRAEVKDGPIAVTKPLKRGKSVGSDSKIKVTLTMVENWRKSLQKNKSHGQIHELIRAFKAAVRTAASTTDSTEPDDDMKYSVRDVSVFNAIVALCVKEIHPTLQAVLDYYYKSNKHNPRVPLPQCSKDWSKYRLIIKTYLSDLIRLLNSLSETTVTCVTLRHFHLMVPFYLCFPKLNRIITKLLVKLWSTGEETVQILAFITLNKSARLSKTEMLEYTLKQMYMGYVRNCKYSSPTLLPKINFMQRSLIEMFSLDINMTYQHAFVYIRQLAIHLRNAITIKKKDSYQTVYNWPYIYCIYLWCRLLSTLYPSETLQHLIYPLVQIIIGTIKLNPTPSFYPLRFHCVRGLHMLNGCTDTYIPVLPFLLEVLDSIEVRRNAKVSIKPFNFACILKFSKSQLHERAFYDGIIDQLYTLLLESFNIHSHCISFPEIVFPAVLQMKDFLRRCKVANFCRQIKQLLSKVEESTQVITQRRSAVSFHFTDVAAVSRWEENILTQGTPLIKYYTSWKKLRQIELLHEVAGKEQIVGDDLPEMRKRTPGEREAKKAEDKSQFTELFQSDSEDEGDLMTEKTVGDSKSPPEDDDKQSLADEDDEMSSTESNEDNNEQKEPTSKTTSSHKLQSDDISGPSDVLTEFKFSDDEDD